MALAVRFATLTDGTSYTAQTTLDANKVLLPGQLELDKQIQPQYSDLQSQMLAHYMTGGDVAGGVMGLVYLQSG